MQTDWRESERARWLALVPIFLYSFNFGFLFKNLIIIFRFVFMYSFQFVFFLSRVPSRISCSAYRISIRFVFIIKISWISFSTALFASLGRDNTPVRKPVTVHLSLCVCKCTTMYTCSTSPANGMRKRTHTAHTNLSADFGCPPLTAVCNRRRRRDDWAAPSPNPIAKTRTMTMKTRRRRI
jgi:hypothetical protein